MICCHARYILPIVFFLISISAHTHAEMATDFELIRTTLVVAMDKHLHHLPLPLSASITVHSDGTKDANNWIVEHELTKFLLDKGYNVVAVNSQDTLRSHAATDSTVATIDTAQTIESPQETSPSTITHSLLFRIVDLKINYTPRSTMRFFQKSVRRSAILSFTLRIVDHRDETTTWASWISDYRSDTVPKGDLPFLETTPSIKKQTLSHSGKWAEFLTAAGMMAGIIFIAF